LVAKEQNKEGPILFLSCVELCLSFRVRGDRQGKTLRLAMDSANCRHLYQHYQHPEISWMNSCAGDKEAIFLDSKRCDL
jgi:hypothetical protein